MPRVKDATWQAIADHLGITQRHLSNLRASPNAPSGKTIEEWSTFYLSARDDDDLTDGEVVRRKRLAEMREKEATAEMREMECKKQRGELVAAADVRRDCQRAATILQQSLMSMGPGIAVEAQGMLRDPQDVDSLSQFITERVRGALVSCMEKLEGAAK